MYLIIHVRVSFANRQFYSLIYVNLDQDLRLHSLESWDELEELEESFFLNSYIVEIFIFFFSSLIFSLSLIFLRFFIFLIR